MLPWQGDWFQNLCMEAVRLVRHEREPFASYNRLFMTDEYWWSNVLITKPEKKALIQPMINVCGTIIATLPFIIPIMPSIIAGSDMGLGGGFPRPSRSARNEPSLNPDTRYALRVSNAEGDITFAFDRSMTPRNRERCSRIFPRGCFLGAVWSRTVA